VLDNRLRPADALASPKIGGPLLLFFPFLNHMPEGGFLAMAHRVPLQAKPPTLKNRLTVDKILSKPGIESIQITIPVEQFAEERAEQKLLEKAQSKLQNNSPEERRGTDLKGRDHFLTLNFSSSHAGSLRRGNTAMTWAISALIS